jgi:enoyl-CoA hydratase
VTREATIEVEREGILWLTLNKPATRNAFDWEMLDAFARGLDEAEREPGARVVLIRSAVEGVFVAGGDIALMRNLRYGDGQRFLQTGQRLLRRLDESSLVFIALVDGHALGGGMELALACDLIVASDVATFALPETRLGLIPGWGGTQRLARATSPQRARELILTGRRIPASEAFEFGFVNRVVAREAVAQTGLELAGQISEASPTAVVRSKQALVHGSRGGLDQGLAIEGEAWLANLGTANRVEGLSAFLERRTARFGPE